jgi:predicted signal transduction protein with EAL and GGDEF domain
LSVSVGFASGTDALESLFAAADRALYAAKAKRLGAPVRAHPLAGQ